MERKVKILNESGLHARPAAVFVRAASKYKCDVNIESNNSIYNAKSIMGIMSLGAKKGDEIKIITDGIDEKEAVDELVKLIESKFGEE